MSGFLPPHHTLYHILSLLLIGQLASCLDISIPLKAPAAALHLSQSLVSFSIEPDRWTEWVGTTSRNDFLFNTLDNLNQLTGMPPQIRIGGNSQDHLNFGDNVKVLFLFICGVKSLANRTFQFSESIFPAVTAQIPYPEASNVTVGDAYYESAKFLPRSMNS